MRGGRGAGGVKTHYLQATSGDQTIKVGDLDLGSFTVSATRYGGVLVKSPNTDRPVWVELAKYQTIPFTDIALTI